MLVYLLIPIYTLIICGLLELVIRKGSQTGIYNSNKIRDCYGGIVIFVSTFISFILLHCFDYLTVFKLTFFLGCLSCVFIICLTGDLDYNKKNHTKVYTIQSVAKIGIIIICFYIYYCLNEEYWLLKGLLTFLLIDSYERIDLYLNKNIKISYIYFLILGFFYLSWTKDLYIITMIVLFSYNMFTKFKGLEMGKNDLGLVGLVLGLVSCEAFSRSPSLIVSVIFLLLVFRYREIKYSEKISTCIRYIKGISNRESKVKVYGNKYHK